MRFFRRRGSRVDAGLRIARWLACVCALGALTLRAPAAPAKPSPAPAEPDIRRDAVVTAVEQVMPSVVNIGTETIVETRDAFDEIGRAHV